MTSTPLHPARSALLLAGNERFTGPSPALHDGVSHRVEALAVDPAGRLLFVALVTCYLLGRLFGGAAAATEVVVYGITAAFGLDYLVASWGGLWRRG